MARRIRRAAAWSEVVSVSIRLAEDGTTYREVLSETRRELACSYLEEGRLSVTEIAFLLGFLDTSAFSRAFRRWTGEAPSAWASVSR